MLTKAFPLETLIQNKNISYFYQKPCAITRFITAKTETIQMSTDKKRCYKLWYFFTEYQILLNIRHY